MEEPTALVSTSLDASVQCSFSTRLTAVAPEELAYSAVHSNVVLASTIKADQIRLQGAEECQKGDCIPALSAFVIVAMLMRLSIWGNLS